CAREALRVTMIVAPPSSPDRFDVW
nr:immunoglobulin heavy chain junction region [Macaca mulatta]MOV49347.1 immunoglobulin heavy chain junction region [Macaca mulatta]MOV50546.1 immunoglobulin heavy chain junction region [Macaca mulatta]MOV50583.1 immunoglobulin heavy chain junction region [Macaca mulatta]MOV50594.1 immunoglobulin heavy chain junction region [Macaca mulatta]